MCPEYGATVAIFPIDDMTLDYLRLTGRDPVQVALVEAYARAQGLFRTDETPDAEYADTLELDLATVVPSLAGPRRPQDRVALSNAKASFASALPPNCRKASRRLPARGGGTAVRRREHDKLEHGSVVIAAITSCTNTSNPSVMIGAGLRGEESGGEGADQQAVGEDQPGAGLESRHRVPRQGRPATRISTSSASTWSATAAPPASATAARCRTRSAPRSASAAWSSPPCSAAIATSRAASSRTSAPTTSRRRRWWWPTRWPGRWTSTSPPTRWGRARTASRST